jgi:hypothetical protein
MEGCVMTTLRQAAQQALECIERLNAHGWILADFEDEVYAAIASLKAALEQPERRKPLTDEILDDIYYCVEGGVNALETWRQQARAIEAAHNIKEQP